MNYHALRSRFLVLHAEAGTAGYYAIAGLAAAAHSGDDAAAAVCVEVIAYNLREGGEDVVTSCADCGDPCISPTHAPWCDACGEGVDA